MARDIKNGTLDDVLLEELFSVVDLPQLREKLGAKYRDHQLKGKMRPYRECHIKPDLLLVYKIDLDANRLFLARLGTHNQIFNQ